MQNEIGKKIDELSNQLTQLWLEIWVKHSLFTWQWWMLVVLCIVCIILFFLLINKIYLVQSIAYFGLIFIINKYLDDLATTFDWYDYRIQLEPVIPTMVAANLFAIPTFLTIIYQRFRKWKTFLIALVLFSIAVSYVALPLMKKAHIHLEKAWNSHYSFISLFLMAIICKIIVDKAKKVQANARE